MKYDPTFHSNVVSNLRRKYKIRFGVDLNMPDEMVWANYEANYGVEFEGHEDDKEYAIYDALHESMHAEMPTAEMPTVVTNADRLTALAQRQIADNINALIDEGFCREDTTVTALVLKLNAASGRVLGS